jgi:hypothetical protein
MQCCEWTPAFQRNILPRLSIPKHDLSKLPSVTTQFDWRVNWSTRYLPVSRRNRRLSVLIEYTVHQELQPHCGPRVDSASNRNEYHGSSRGGWRPVRRADNHASFMCWLSENSGSLNLLHPSGPIEASTELAVPLPTSAHRYSQNVQATSKFYAPKG